MQKTFYQLTKHEKHITLKPIKAEKELATMHWLGCKDFTHDFKPQVVKMTYKLLREKSDCLVC